MNTNSTNGNSIEGINIKIAHLEAAKVQSDALGVLKTAYDSAKLAFDTAQASFDVQFPELASVPVKGTRKPMSDDTKAKMKAKALERWAKVKADAEALVKATAKGNKPAKSAPALATA